MKLRKKITSICVMAAAAGAITFGAAGTASADDPVQIGNEYYANEKGKCEAAASLMSAMHQDYAYWCEGEGWRGDGPALYVLLAKKK